MSGTPVMRRALRAHRALVRVALSLSVFAWIAVYEWLVLWSGDAIEAFVHVLLLYALSQVAALLIMPVAGTLLRSGIRRTMIIGVLCAALAFALLGLLVSVGPGHYMNVWVLFAVLMGAHRALYHVPYALERAALGTPNIAYQFLACLVPIAFGWGMLMAPDITSACAALLLLSSLVSLFRIPETYERYAWGYRESFSKLLEPRFAPFIDAGLTRGIEAAAFYLIWPFAVFFILGSSYLWLGFVLAFTYLFSALMKTHLPISFASFSPAVHGVAMGSTWIVRLLVASPGGIIFANWLTIIVSPQREVSSDEPVDNATYIDEYSTLKEMASAAGRLVLVLITVLAVKTLGTSTAMIVAFLFAALAAMYSARIATHR